MKLYVDDIRIAPEGWMQAWNAKEALSFLSTGVVTELSLDHDLGGLQPTGYDIMRWIEEESYTNDQFVVPNIIFHTANPVGRENMEAAYAAILKRIR